MKKRILSIILVLGMLLSMVPMMGITASADTAPGGSAVELPKYVKFTGDKEFRLALYNATHSSLPAVSLECSTDGTNWNVFDFSVSKEVQSVNNTVYIRAGEGGNKRFSLDSGTYRFFKFSDVDVNIDVSGNIMALLDKDNPPTTLNNTDNQFCFAYLFASNNIVSVENLALPATTLSNFCYYYMFFGAKIKKAPVLPATNLAGRCYESMFGGCVELIEAPVLPVTTLVKDCYINMFQGCTSLKTAPNLPATTLQTGCYSGMFSGCSSLVNAPALPATDLAGSCYEGMFNFCTSLKKAPDILATSVGESSCLNMFANCTALETAPRLTATTVGNNGYSQMFMDCTALEVAPELPATTLGEDCYCAMFKRCTSLIYAPSILPAETLNYECYASMFSGCTKLTEIPKICATMFHYGAMDCMFINCSSLLIAEAPENADAKLIIPNPLRFAYDPTGDGSVGDTAGSMFYGTAGIVELDTGNSTTLQKGKRYMTLDYLKFTGTETFKITVGRGSKAPDVSDKLEYSLDGLSNWTKITYDTAISSGDGKTVYFRGNGISTFGTEEDPGWYVKNHFSISNTTGTVAASGNTMTLLDWKNSPTQMTSANKGCFAGMFINCEKLTAAPKLPATILAEGCYAEMFEGCTALKATPIIKANQFGKYSCYKMFESCTSLDTIKSMTVTSVDENSLNCMFNNCSSLRVVNVTKSEFATWTFSGDAATDWNKNALLDTANNINLELGKIYTIAVDIEYSDCTNGSVSGPDFGAPGETITVTPTADSGNTIDKVYYNDGTQHEITPVSGVYSFTMPNKAVTVSATFTVVPIPEAVKDATYSASLTLGKNIDVNFKMGNIASADKDKFLITVDGTPVSFDLKDGIASCVLKAVEPKDISKDIHVVVIYDGVTVKNFYYAVLNYCNAVYNHKNFGASSDLGKLCTAILNYGKYAEDYANGNTASTINTGHEIDFGKVNLPKSKRVFTPNTTYGDNGSCASLTLGSTIKLNYLVKTTDFEYMLTLVNGMTNAKAVEDGKYKTGQTPFAQNFFILNENKEQIDPAKIDVAETTGGYIISVDLYAYQLANEYTLKVKGVDSKVFEITFGVYDYCVYINANDYDTSLKSLCKAIYNYSEAVKAYANAQ